MKWITRENVGVDRMGSAWLIARFIDPKAKFSFVPVGQSPLPAGYEPFDMPGVRYSHRREHCTFHTLMTEHKLTDPVLVRIASMIDEADIAQAVSVEPVALGLDFICRGLRLTSADDQIAIERGRLVYEALYAQIKAELRQ